LILTWNKPRYMPGTVLLDVPEHRYWDILPNKAATNILISRDFFSDLARIYLHFYGNFPAPLIHVPETIYGGFTINGLLLNYVKLSNKFVGRFNPLYLSHAPEISWLDKPETKMHLSAPGNTIWFWPSIRVARNKDAPECAWEYNMILAVN
jgi:hypothetical protein